MKEIKVKNVQLDRQQIKGKSKDTKKGSGDRR
jgi:hypothetical protein